MYLVPIACSVLSVAREGKKSKKEISREKVCCLFTCVCVCAQHLVCLSPGCHGCHLPLTTDGQRVHADTSESSVCVTVRTQNTSLLPLPLL